jgi:hypothetical protein
MTTAALVNDNGWAAWQIANIGSPQQAIYSQKGGTGPYYPEGSGLTQAHIDDILANGFILSLRARIVQGPTYDVDGTQQPSAAVAVAGFSGFRFEIALGSDGLGNTLVVLPSAVNQVGSIFSYEPFGSPLVVSGTDYHLYQLSYDPVSIEASLFIDGVLQATGYGGAGVSGGAVANNFGLELGALNLATANFALAKLESGYLCATYLIGDLDEDGDADGSDLATLAKDYGREDCPCEGDVNGDNVVDEDDLALFSEDFGKMGCALD